VCLVGGDQRDADQIAGVIEDAYLTVGPKKLIEAAKIDRPE